MEGPPHLVVACSCLSFRSEAEESAFALLVILAQPESLSLPFCLSFRSEAEESAFALLVILAQPESLSLPFCLSFRSEAEESASAHPLVILSAAGCPMSRF